MAQNLTYPKTMIYVLAGAWRLALAGVAFSLFYSLPHLVRFDDVGLGGRLKPHKAKGNCNEPSMHFGKWAQGPSLRAIVRSGGSRVTQVAFLALVQIAEAATRCRFGARRGISRGESRLPN
jgi:hypothetical protein